MSDNGRFLSRLIWITIAAMLLVLLLRASPDYFAWDYFFNGGERQQAEPRTVVARGSLAEDEQSTIALFENSRDAVVFITTRQHVRDAWTRNIFSVPSGTGSGFIWDDQGHIITNFHVIKGASEATVRLADGRDYKAALVGASPAHDIAVLKIGIGYQRPSPVPLGTSHDLKVGQKVFAIGNPFGLDWTLTTGIVSALDRSLPGEGGRIIDNLIQTDAAINPGNSGGPLLDSGGRLIGVNTQIYSPSGGSAGIGFAIPVDEVNWVVPDLIEFGQVRRPTLGVELLDGARLGVVGALITRVHPGSGAAEAGLRPTTRTRLGGVELGDVIIGIENQPVRSSADVRLALERRQPGETVTVKIRRGRRDVEVPVTLSASK